MSTFRRTLAAIRPLDHAPEKELRAHLDDLTKPRGSLGRLEDIACQYGLITGRADRLVLEKKRIYTLAGDHGVTAEGVSAYPKAVTPQMVRNMLAGGAAINVLARYLGVELRVVDLGVDDPLDHAPGLVDRKVRRGTRNLLREPAMTEAETVQALEAGIGLAHEASRDGVHLLGLGDMGIGNTTPSAALLAALLPCAPADITGRGTGVDDAGLERKRQVIAQALEHHRACLDDPLSALAALGGLEIAGLAGLALGASEKHLPVVVDGFIASAAALAACRLCPAVREYLFFAHLSAEKGHRLFCTQLGVQPLLNLEMRLGDGTGAALAMAIIEAAVRIYNEMATFSSAKVSGRNG
jgi:nicotinate-nucleotide--dimethylbenzimidazole phosphoribosyltransferase